jgi:hypothetical protein
MAKMTKAQKLIVEQDNRELAEALARVAYPARLMQALERATGRDFNMELTVVNMQFQVEDRDNLDNTWVMAATWNPVAWELDDFENYLDRRAAEKVQAQRKADLRRDALAKLTDEEKELLNLF